MTIKITDERIMTSDQTGHRATWSPDAAADGQGAWTATWLPLRLLTRNQAITALTLAEAVNGGGDLAHRLQVHVGGWAAELDLDEADAVRLAKDPI